MNIGIVSDPGFATRVAASVADRVPSLIARRGAQRTDEIAVDQTSAVLPPREDGGPALAEWDRLLADRNDVSVVISEMPHRHSTKPVIAEVYKGRTCVLYTPAFGVLFTRRRAVTTAAQIVSSMVADPSERPSAAPRGTYWETSQGETADEDAEVDRLVASSFAGRVRLLAGMIRSNRPWRLIPTLTGALGAASAASAFGVFYSNIWIMAAAMMADRLLMISVAAVLAMSLWLILPNGLWEKREFRESSSDRALYNLATVGTVLTGVLCMYALLFVAVLLACVVVIAPDYFTAQVGKPVTVVEYLKLTWLATSLGIVAGAVGSSVSDRGEILRATFGRREIERRQRAEEDAEDAQDDSYS